MKTSNTNVITLAALLVAACGGDGTDSNLDNGTSSDNSPSSARQQCENLVTAMCGALADCAVRSDEISSNARGTFVAECRKNFAEQEFCSDVIGVSSDYRECLEDIQQDSCFDVDDLPSSCDDVILS